MKPKRRSNRSIVNGIVGILSSIGGESSHGKLCQVGERVVMVKKIKRNGVIDGDGTTQTVTCQNHLTYNLNHICNDIGCKLIFTGSRNGHQVENSAHFNTVATR